MLAPDNRAFRDDFARVSRARVARSASTTRWRSCAVKIGRARRARLLPGHRALGLQPGRSGQPPSRRLRGSAAQLLGELDGRHPPADASASLRAAAARPEDDRLQAVHDGDDAARAAARRDDCSARRLQAAGRRRERSRSRVRIRARPWTSARRSSPCPGWSRRLVPDGDARRSATVWGDTRDRGCRTTRRAVYRQAFTGALRDGDRAGRPPVRSSPPTRSSTSRSRFLEDTASRGLDDHRHGLHRLAGAVVLFFTPRIDYHVTTPLRPDSDEFLHVIQSTCQAAIHSQQPGRDPHQRRAVLSGDARRDPRGANRR